MVIQTLTVAKPKRCLTTRLRNECIHQSGLADPRFSADEYYLTRSAQRPLQAVIEEFQLLPTLYKVGGSRLHRRKAEFEPGPGFAVLDLPDSGDKPVSPAGNGFDVFLPGCRFTESLAQSRNVVGKIAFFYNGIRPNATDQLVFVDKAPVRFHEHTKSLENLFAQSDRLSLPN
jgi:hypothetical protein